MEDVLKVLRPQRPFMEDVLKVLRAQETFHGRCFKGTASTGDLSWKMF